MFALYDAMQKTHDFDNKLLYNEYCLQGCMEGRYDFFTRPSTAGTIRTQVIFEGGLYMMKYVMYCEVLFCHSLPNISLYVLLNG